MQLAKYDCSLLVRDIHRALQHDLSLKNYPLEGSDSF